VPHNTVISLQTVNITHKPEVVDWCNAYLSPLWCPYRGESDSKSCHAAAVLEAEAKPYPRK